MKFKVVDGFTHKLDNVSTLSASDAPLSANASRFSGLLASSLLLVIGAALCLMVFSLYSKTIDSSLALSKKPVVMISFKEYLEISVKNDEQLIKMATIIQRIMSNNTNSDGFGISELSFITSLSFSDK